MVNSIGINSRLPWPRCGKRQLKDTEIDYAAEVRHDGRLYAFTVHGLQLQICQACGERVYTEHVDAQISQALRDDLGLLSPAQIRAAIDRLGMSQKQVSERLGIAEETLSRWLNECRIQSRAMDNLMRVFFAFPGVRAALAEDPRHVDLGVADLA